MTAPIAAGYIPLGIAYGILVMQLGMPWWMAPALSIAAFSGSAELLVITLAASYTPIAVIAVTMLLVNFRHLFYAFSFPLHLVEGRFARFFSMYALVDEAYAITAARRRLDEASSACHASHLSRDVGGLWFSWRSCRVLHSRSDPGLGFRAHGTVHYFDRRFNSLPQGHSLGCFGGWIVPDRDGHLA